MQAYWFLSARERLSTLLNKKDPNYEVARAVFEELMRGELEEGF